MSQTKNPVFVSLGMFLLDELRFADGKRVEDVPGGSGLYATLGARLFKPNATAADVGCLLVAGHDLPESTLHLLKSWQMNLVLALDAEKPCTRGLLEYEPSSGHNTFTYVTPPLRPSPVQLGTSSLLFAQSFHFLALPEHLEEQVSTLLRLRAEQGVTARPLIAWEPAPLGCDKVNLESHLKACALADIVSPNRSELRHLVEGKGASEIVFARSVVEALAEVFVEAGIGPNGDGLMVVRSGEHGVLMMSKDMQPKWSPAYHEKDASEVVDPTGAGNTFVGAFAVALLETKDPAEAALRASVAASYAIEQFGPPTLTPASESAGELWNGTEVLSRLQNLKARVSQA
ncbi:Ribokinase-like protein [Astrocystis sublimbata]|nr:Ribokinase-like protein [Astrocystis sublimbata]